MKNAFQFLLFALLAISLMQCKKRAEPMVPNPTDLTSVKDSQTVSEWYCTPIAPIPQIKDRSVGQIGKFWPNGSTIKIGFMPGGTEAKKTLVKSAYAAWAQSANLNFTYPDVGPYDIRVAFSTGSAWSYIGTDCKSVPDKYATLNFGFGFGPTEIAAGRSSTAEHEAGHSLGLLHEQQLLGGVCYNEANVISDLQGPPNNWSLETIRFNVLDYHNPANVITNGYYKTSIMHYAIPARWTCDNKAIVGGTKISEADKAFIAARYPKLSPPPPSGISITRAQADSIKSASSNLNELIKRVLK